MTSIEEQIEITKNTLEVLENEKRKRDEKLLNDNSMLQILELVRSFEKRLESVENRLQMLEENKKFIRLMNENFERKKNGMKVRSKKT